MTVPWDLRPHPVPRHRVQEQVLATPAYEVWVVGWPPGTTWDVAGDGSPGAFCVVAGELELEEAGPGAAPPGPRRWGPGRGAVTGPDRSWPVANRSAAVATSVHVWAPPRPWSAP